MKLMYFAWLRSKIGVAEETVSPPDEVGTVAELIAWLKGRGPNYAEALANDSVVKVAVNQEYARRDQAVRAGHEVALFPPVTGA